MSFCQRHVCFLTIAVVHALNAPAEAQTLAGPVVPDGGVPPAIRGVRPASAEERMGPTAASPPAAAHGRPVRFYGAEAAQPLPMSGPTYASGPVVVSGGRPCGQCPGCRSGHLCAWLHRETVYKPGWHPTHHHWSVYEAPRDLVYPPPQVPGAIVQYPYYTLKGPDDFFLK